MKKIGLAQTPESKGKGAMPAVEQPSHPEVVIRADGHQALHQNFPAILAGFYCIVAFIVNDQSEAGPDRVTQFLTAKRIVTVTMILRKIPVIPVQLMQTDHGCRHEGSHP